MLVFGKFMTTLATTWLTYSIVFSTEISSVEADMALKRLPSYSWQDKSPIRKGLLNKSHHFDHSYMDTNTHADPEDDYSSAMLELLHASRGLQGVSFGQSMSFSFPLSFPLYSGEMSFSFSFPDFSFSLPSAPGMFSFPMGDDDDDDDLNSACPSIGGTIQFEESFVQLSKPAASCPAGGIKCRGEAVSGDSYMNEFAFPLFYESQLIACKPDGETDEALVMVSNISWKDANTEQTGFTLEIVGGDYLLSAVYMKAGKGGNLYSWDNGSLFGGSNQGTFATPDNKGISHVSICVVPCVTQGTHLTSVDDGGAQQSDGSSSGSQAQLDGVGVGVRSTENEGLSSGAKAVLVGFSVFGAAMMATSIIMGKRYNQRMASTLMDESFMSASVNLAEQGAAV